MPSVMRMEDITLAQAVFLCDVFSLARAGRPYWKSRKEIGLLVKLKERAVTKLIAELVELGYICRHCSEDDGGRRWYITLTPSFYERAGLPVQSTPALPCYTHWHSGATPTGTTVPDPIAPPCYTHWHSGASKENTYRDPQESNQERAAREETEGQRPDTFTKADDFTAVPQDIIDSTIQLTGGTIAGPVYEQLTGFVKTYGEAWTRRAIEIARERDARNLRYVLGILRSWKRNGYDGDVRSATDRRREADAKRQAEVDFYNRMANERLAEDMRKWEMEENGQTGNGADREHQEKRDGRGRGGGGPEVPLRAVQRTGLHLYQA